MVITIESEDLREIIHDALGDTQRYEVVLEGNGRDVEWSLDPILYGEGDALDPEDLPGLERRIMNMVMEYGNKSTNTL